jgi:hypothetical protein
MLYDYQASTYPKMHFFLPNYQRLSVAARKKIWMALRKKIGMTTRKNMRLLGRKMAESKIIGMPTVRDESGTDNIRPTDRPKGSDTQMVRPYSNPDI